MRVFVDQLAVYFTFTHSTNTQIFITPSQQQLEAAAEDKQGYISATIRNIIVTSRSQTTISHIQSMPRMAILPRSFSSRIRSRRTDLRRRLGHCSIDHAPGSMLSISGQPIGEVHDGRPDRCTGRS